MPPKRRFADREVAKGPRPAPGIGVRFAAGLLIVAAVFAVAELSLSLLPRVAGSSARSFIYVPPDIERGLYERFMALRDPIVAWPLRFKRVDGQPAARPSPAFPGASEWCVTLYGDSFTYSDEVSNADAWGNVLARRLGCPVGNFGISGYGTDQALLWFAENKPDHAPITVVGIYADNLQRNVNQYRYFITGGEEMGLKPRFVLENGNLKLVPLPVLSYDQLMDGLRDPRGIFPHEVFLPGSRFGQVVWSFPYTFSMVKLMRTDQAANYLNGRPTWVDFYRSDHESRALPTTVAIVEEFRRRSAPGKTVLTVLFPSASAYKLARSTGVSPLEPLAAALEARGQRTRDLTTDLANYLGERSVCELMTEQEACRGHYNINGNRVLADAVHRFLTANR